MVVHTSRKRTDASPQKAAERDAEFYDRIAGPYWDQVRDVINEWWSHLPGEAQPGLCSRLLDRNSDPNVRSALWELYLHEMLLGSGCTVEIEHRIGTRGKNPDFLVTRDGEQFVMEAIWTPQRLGDVMSSTLPPQLTDAINAVPSPNFFISYEVARTGVGAPSQKRLTAGLTRWLASLDPNQVHAGYERGMPMPEHVWEEGGWCLAFMAFPRSPGTRGDSASRTIGFHPPVFRFGDESGRILNAVKKKGGKYGDLGLPFIVAVGNAAAFPDGEDTESALYGSWPPPISAGALAFGRMTDGYWTGTYARAHSRVSGVLTVDNPAPWTWSKNTPVLWQSPHPSSLAAPILPSWATMQLIDGRAASGPADRPVHTALGLPQDWPFGEAFPQRPPQQLKPVSP
ncbi:hypothetical protein POF50_011375 [Streptomyces sp. SL13]|uniref:Uncharacterized protein n=1 Tax=Streptantibioticus silvisoli TaxID=2705255 RepID=A0AA90KG01_9ACTN|nr:hypothetical protein [Streptantibioticus silvisoli]MDI5969930.1 hypothetical protein [Streptantibioticus silvisoli]